ncbi:anti-sigma factor family protein [Paraburkholderia lycopersici]|uniref:Transmembrane transcriptional regulator (Anti-sigma factor RsiW) n=1 Tax=Paraburkholderia lycopersici TaxID=416944 RepID=A0A1G6L7H6_9BURK|nr:anti-sigma factor [Paraburkholderia lycopersici]SDC39239.1 Transmembrane transcriptional regulator (anti-sigma factor RsiW) [Paraburkholderia lycopersici]
MNHDDLDHEHEGMLPGGPEEDLSMLGAFVDDELPPGERAALQARLASDPQAAGRVAGYRAQKAALRALCEGARVGGERAASASDDAPTVLVLRARTPWWWRAGIAAAWAALGAGLAVAATALVPRLAPGLAPALVAGATPAATRFETPEAFARRADVAYAVYSPEQRHPVEVGAADEAHLVAWLSKRLGKRLSVPSLAEYGYALVGGRLLPGNSGPAAQFMYENDAGERLTLYVSSSGIDRDAVRLLRDGNRRTFYWSTDRMGYALSGPQTEPQLRDIALEVCGALGGKPAQW